MEGAEFAVRSLDLGATSSYPEVDEYVDRDVENIVRKIVIQRRPRLKYWFEDFDKLHTQRVTRPQFERGLHMAQVELSADEVAQLADHYTVEHGFVNYGAFCDQIDKVFTEKNLERSPTKKPHKFTQEIHPFGSTLSSDDARRAESVMEMVRNWVHVRGVIPKSLAQDFDVSNNGFITKAQFKRVLHMLNLQKANLAASEIELLCMKYADKLNDINYRRFHEDASRGPSTFPSEVAYGGETPEMAPGSRGGGGGGGGGDAAVGSDAIHALMSRLIRLASSQRIRVKESFTDYDPRRTGLVTEAHFYRGLAMAFRTAFDAAELGLLAQRFGVRRSGFAGDGTGELFVNYRALCAEVDSAFTEPQLEKSPTKRIGQSEAAHIARGPRYEPNMLSPAEERQLEAYLSDMRVKVQQRRIDMKDEFQDYDRNQRETVTQTQFERVLKANKLHDAASATQLGLLLDKFSFKSSAHGARLVHYNAFLDSLHNHDQSTFVWSDGRGAFGVNTKFLASTPPEEASVDVRVTHGHGHGHGHHRDHSEHLPLIMHSLREHVSSKRIRVREFFSDYDGLRKGRISFLQFKSGLNLIMPALPPAHLAAIVREYITEDTRHLFREDGIYVGGQPLIEWRRFSDDVDRVFTLPDLEKDPTIDVLGETARVRGLGAPAKRGGLGAAQGEDRSTLSRTTMQELKLHVTTRNKLVAPDFQAYDRANTGTLPNTQFDRALNAAFSDFITPAKKIKFDAIAHMYRVYDVNKEREYESTSRFDVDYRSFCRDVEGGVVGGGAGAAGGVVSEALDEMVACTTASPRLSVAVDTDAVMTKLQEIVKTRRINLKSFLQTHDGLRTGKVTRAKFMISLVMALGITAASVTEREMLAVAARYAAAAGEGARSDTTDNPDVDYVSFVFDLTSEGAEGLERSPTKVLSPLKFARASYKDSPAAGSRLDSLLKDISRQCMVHRLDLKPYFQDYDTLRTGKVTKTQFLAVLNKANAMPPRDGESLILDAFGFGEARDKCNYVRFCKAVEWDMHKANGVR